MSETDLNRNDRKGLKLVWRWLKLPCLTLVTILLRSLSRAQPLPSELPTEDEDDEDAEDGADGGDGDGDDEGGVGVVLVRDYLLPLVRYEEISSFTPA